MKNKTLAKFSKVSTLLYGFIALLVTTGVAEAATNAAITATKMSCTFLLGQPEMPKALQETIKNQ